MSGCSDIQYRSEPIPYRSALEIRQDLLAGREIALLDVREEAEHAGGHPLFAANLPYSRLELEADERIPRRSSTIVVFDDGEGLAIKSADRLLALGYSNVHLLEGGLQGWRDAGYELFQDVNAPSKAFGELVEAKRHTPSLTAQEVQSLIDAEADIVILDARRFTEYSTMSIPKAISVPGAELALRVRQLAPSASTRVIVNCAGRTRSIIGTQSLINAGIPNPVAALRNGTIGWTLARQHLEHGQRRRYSETSPEDQRSAATAARRLADKAGVQRTTLAEVDRWLAEDTATIYRFDVRSPEEYAVGSVSGFMNAAGGQLVQETDMFAPVRNARIVLLDDDGVRANMTASWLAQMAWEVFVVDELSSSDFAEHPVAPFQLPQSFELSSDTWISPSVLAEWLRSTKETTVILDFAPSDAYAKQHIEGAWFALRSIIHEAFQSIPSATKLVLTSSDGLAAQLAWSDVIAHTAIPVFVLKGGTRGWSEGGLPLTNRNARYACRPIDRYKRPYEGTDIDPAAMQAYLDWEFGLVQQLERDGTHGFRVLA